MNTIKIFIVTCISVFAFVLGYGVGQNSSTTKFNTIPTTYSNKEVDNLIVTNAYLASKIKQQMDYEQSFSSNH